MAQEVFSHVLIISSIFLLVLPNTCNATELKACGFNAMFVFGASESDAGNSIVQIPQAYHGRLPYGMTLNKTTGRATDGLMIVDYIAQAAGLPLVDAFLNPHATNFNKSGVNFAFAGSPTLTKDALAKVRIKPSFINSSLTAQLTWLDQYMAGGFCNGAQDCRQKFQTALFSVWFGPNDYNLALTQGQTTDEVKTNVVPAVMEAIYDGITELIEYGGIRFLVPGFFNFGCTASYLTMYAKNDSVYDDELHCLKEYDDFYKFHNDQIQATVKRLKKNNPNVHIVYGDMYNAAQSAFDNYQSFGIKSLSKACCGTGGEYNYSSERSRQCGAPGVPFCSDPEHYIFWDGLHLTQNTNMLVAKKMIQDMLPKFQCNA